MIRIIILMLYTLSLYGGHLNFAYGSSSMDEFSKKDTRIAMTVWIQELLRGSENTVLVTFYSDLEKMAKDFEAGKLDLALTFGLEFVKYFDKSKLLSGFTGGMHNQNHQNLILVVHKDNTKENLLVLKKPIVAVQGTSSIFKLYTKYYFLSNKSKNKVNFLDTRKARTALLKVFFKQADAALITQKTFQLAAELNPQIKKNLQIIEQTDIPAGSFCFFRKGVDEEIRKIVLDKALNLSDTEIGKRVLTIFHTERVIKLNVTELAPIEKLYNDYNKIKNL